MEVEKTNKYLDVKSVFYQKYEEGCHNLNKEGINDYLNDKYKHNYGRKYYKPFKN